MNYTFIFGLAICMVLLMIMSYVLRKKVSTIEDYYVMGRSAKWFMMAGTTLATWMSAGTLLSVAGLAWHWGPFPAWAFYGSFWGVLLLIFVFGPPLRRAGYLTVPDFFGDRFQSNRVRSAAIFALLFAVYFNLVMQVQGGAIMMEQLCGVSYGWGIVIFLGVLAVMLYFSGMWSVIITDTIGMVVLAVVSLLILPLTIIQLGGWSHIMATVSQLKGPEYWTTFGLSKQGLGYWLGNHLSWVFILAVSPHMVGRIFAANDIKDVYKGGIWTLIVGFLMCSFLFLTMVCLNVAIAPGTVKPDALPLVAAQKVWPLFIGFFYVLAIYMAAITTAIALMITGGEAVARDIYQQILKPNADHKSIILLTRLWIVFFSAAAAVLAYFKFDFLVMTGTMSGTVLAFGFFPVILASMFWPKITGKAAEWVLWISVPVSGIAVLTWYKLKWFTPHPTLWGVAIGVVLVIVLSYLTSKTNAEIKVWGELKEIMFPKKPIILKTRGEWRFAGISLATLIGLVVIVSSLLLVR